MPTLLKHDFPKDKTYFIYQLDKIFLSMDYSQDDHAEHLLTIKVIVWNQINTIINIFMKILG